MSSITRVTEPTLDVLDILLQAHLDGRKVHGWEIKKATGRSGPTVYGVIDRLEGAHLIEGRWETQAPESTGPRRRYYSLTSLGVTTAGRLLSGRRGRGRLPKVLSSFLPASGPAETGPSTSKHYSAEEPPSGIS
jgi:DNA-binding PadR family transcriptional regulator